MNLLNIIPLIGASWGVLFTFFLVANKRIHLSNPKAKNILIVIILLLTHNLIDSFLNYNGYEDALFSGFSYIHYHLIGYLVLVYTNTLLKFKPIPKIWHYLVALLFVVRTIVLLVEIEYDESFEDLVESGEMFYTVDYILALFMNIIPLVYLYFKLKALKPVVKLEQPVKTEFFWLNHLIGLSAIIYLAILLSSMASMFSDREWFFFAKIESLITCFFFFGFAYLAIRFPVFTIQGDYTELQPDVQVKKYATSTLKDETSEALWQKITHIMETEKLWQNPEFRLNDLAEKTGATVHHVSQTLNEKKQLNFFDFVNQYRINQAKELLTSEKGQQFTILAIAFEVGFNSKTTFYNAFRKETNMTPSEYKKSVKTL